MMAQYSDYAMPYGWGEFDEPCEPTRKRNPRPPNPFLKLKVGEERTIHLYNQKDISRTYARAKAVKERYGMDVTYSSRNGVFTIRRNT